MEEVGRYTWAAKGLCGGKNQEHTPASGDSGSTRPVTGGPTGLLELQHLA